jgi:hypothetical protein
MVTNLSLGEEGAKKNVYLVKRKYVLNFEMQRYI